MKVKLLFLISFVIINSQITNKISYAQSNSETIIGNDVYSDSSLYTQDLSEEDMSGGLVFSKDSSLSDAENIFVKSIFERNHNEIINLLSLNNDNSTNDNSTSNLKIDNPNIIYTISYDNNTKNNPIKITPIHIALANNDIDTLTLLLKSDKINVDNPSCINLNVGNKELKVNKNNKNKKVSNNSIDSIDMLNKKDNHTNNDNSSIVSQSDNKSEINANVIDNNTYLQNNIKTKACSVVTPVSYAILKNNLKAAKILLDRGANPNFIPTGGNPPIYYAKSKEAIKLLKDYNANINKKSEVSDSPLFDAVKNKDTKLLEELIFNGAKVNVKNKAGETLLYKAIQNSDFDIARFLIDKNADINLTSGKDKISPLMATIANPKHDSGFLRYIIFKGANVNYKDVYGRNCFYYHYIPENLDDVDRLKESLEILIEYNANINNQDKNGNTLLHKNYKYYYKIYKDFKPNINIQNNEGNTPLHIATMEGNIVSILTGAPNKNIKNHKGLTPIMIAQKLGNKTNIDYLKLNNMEYLLIAGAISGNKEMVNNSIDKGINLNNPINGHLPLYYAAKGGNSDVLLLMLNGGANLSMLPNFIDIVLDGFSDNRNQLERVNLIKTIIDNEISPNWDKYKDFILKLVNIQCKDNKGHGYIKDILTYAIEKGGNPNYKDENGVTALYLAASSKYPSFDLIHVLISSGVNVDEKTVNNSTALYECAKVPYDKYEEFEALIKNSKININTRFGNDNTTMLMEAAKNGNRLVTTILIAKGADDSLKNSDNLTALDLSKAEFDKLNSKEDKDINSIKYKNYEFLTKVFLSDKNSLSECRSGIMEECKKFYQVVNVNKNMNLPENKQNDNNTYLKENENNIGGDSSKKNTFITNIPNE